MSNDFDELIEAINKENGIEDDPPSYRVLSREEQEYAWSKVRFKLEIIRAFEESYDRSNKKEGL